MTSPLALAALVLALAVHVDLLSRLRTAEPASPWWFGYARDGVNMSASLMLWGGYLFAGFHAAEALLLAMLTTLGTYLLDWTIARGLGVRRARLAIALPLGAWVAVIAFLPDLVGARVAWLVAVNSPR